MSLRLLMIPFSIVMVLVISIGYIKPDLVMLEEKKQMHILKGEETKTRDGLLAAISNLAGALDAGKNNVDFVKNYVPEKMDQERVIDTYNYLASQSGVAVVLMNVKEVSIEEKNARDALAATGSVDSTTEVLGADGLPTTPPTFSLATEGYIISVTVKGQYANIKDFFERVAHMDRIHRTRNFSIAVEDKEASEEILPEEVGVLTGIFEADFDYAPVGTVASAATVPVFTRGTFDVAKIDETRSWVTSIVPALNQPQSGRPNPFQ
jgi:Tfp pilus assembly protein PilO